MYGLLLALVLSQTPPTVDTWLARAATAYNDADFDVALQALAEAERLTTTDQQRVAVFLTRGIVLAHVPNPTGANAAWEKALAIDAFARLPLPVSSKVRADYERTQARIQGASLLLTPPPLPMVRGPLRLPISGVSLGLGLVAAGIATGFGVSVNSTLQDIRAATYADQKRTLYASAEQRAVITNVGFGIAAAFALTAVLTYFLIHE